MATEHLLEALYTKTSEVKRNAKFIKTGMVVHLDKFMLVFTTSGHFLTPKNEDFSVLGDAIQADRLFITGNRFIATVGNVIYTIAYENRVVANWRLVKNSCIELDTFVKTMNSKCCSSPNVHVARVDKGTMTGSPVLVDKGNNYDEVLPSHQNTVTGGGFEPTNSSLCFIDLPGTELTEWRGDEVFFNVLLKTLIDHMSIGLIKHKYACPKHSFSLIGFLRGVTFGNDYDDNLAKFLACYILGDSSMDLATVVKQGKSLQALPKSYLTSKENITNKKNLVTNLKKCFSNFIKTSEQLQDDKKEAIEGIIELYTAFLSK